MKEGGYDLSYVGDVCQGMLPFVDSRLANFAVQMRRGMLPLSIFVRPILLDFGRWS